jgi:hypothetical protein
MNANARRTTSALLFTLALLLTETGRRFYRPYIYAAGIDDFGLADTIGNLGGTVAIVFFDAAIVNWTPRQTLRFTWIMIVPGLIVYEALQGNLLRGTFDWADLLATVLGGCIATLLNFCVSGQTQTGVTPTPPTNEPETEPQAR